MFLAQNQQARRRRRRRERSDTDGRSSRFVYSTRKFHQVGEEMTTKEEERRPNMFQDTPRLGPKPLGMK